MQESKRTLIFVGTALVMVALAAGTHFAMQPASLEEFSDVNEEFFPDFKDPNSATGLRVAAYDKEAARVAVFNVQFKDGLWRIPSHHNYPADGEERLSRTASSVIGIKRGALAGTSKEDFKRLGVLDPLDESVTGTEGRGDRITLFDGDNVLADFIIGKQVEGQANTYLVRKPGENRTYRALLNIDISTKFADWIEPGLLDVRRADLREIEIDGYSIDETRGVLVPGEVSRLTRPSSEGSWELAGIAKTEKVKTSEVNAMINALEDLKIVGVRAKPTGLSADLKGEGGARLDPIARLDLESKGYFIDAQGALVSNEGEVRVGTSEGTLYVLRFGEVFTGTDVEIEVGKSKADGGDSETQAESDNKDTPAKDGEADDAESQSQQQSRYLFITAQFDESLIQPPAEKPVKPEEPAAKADDEAADSAEDQPEEATEAKDAAEEQPGDETTTEPADDAAYQQALADYETKRGQWEREQETYEEQLEKGRKRVAELNARFADWYYVISAESFDDIRVARSDLVEAKEPEEETDAADSSAPAAAPPVPGLQPEETSDSDSSEKEAEPDTDNDTGNSDSFPPIDESKLPPAEPDVTSPSADNSPEDSPQQP